MERKPFAVARHRYIGRMAFHARRSEHMGAVHRPALRLVDRGRIAMIDVSIVFRFERDLAALVCAHRPSLRAGPCDRAQSPGLVSKSPLVPPKDAAVAVYQLPPAH